jgi:hypothetical protein
MHQVRVTPAYDGRRTFSGWLKVWVAAGIMALAAMLLNLGQSAHAAGVSRQQAEALVQALPEVQQELHAGPPLRKLEFNAEEKGRYIFRLVVALPGGNGDPPRITCIGWYAVDKATGRAYSFTPGVD